MAVTKKYSRTQAAQSMGENVVRALDAVRAHSNGDRTPENLPFAPPAMYVPTATAQESLESNVSALTDAPPDPKESPPPPPVLDPATYPYMVVIVFNRAATLFKYASNGFDDRDLPGVFNSALRVALETSMVTQRGFFNTLSTNHTAQIAEKDAEIARLRAQLGG